MSLKSNKNNHKLYRKLLVKVMNAASQRPWVEGLSVKLKINYAWLGKQPSCSSFQIFFFPQTKFIFLTSQC